MSKHRKGTPPRQERTITLRVFDEGEQSSSTKVTIPDDVWDIEVLINAREGEDCTILTAEIFGDPE